MARHSGTLTTNVLHDYNSSNSSAVNHLAQFTHRAEQGDWLVKGLNTDRPLTRNQSRAAHQMGMFNSLSSGYHTPYLSTSVAFQGYPHRNLQSDFQTLLSGITTDLEKKLNQMLSTSKSIHVPDLFATFQNKPNFNTLDKSTSSSKINYHRKQKRNKPKQSLRHTSNDIPTNFSREQRQGYQDWNYEPNFNWPQSNLPQTRKTKTNFRNQSRYKTSNNLDKPDRYEFDIPPRGKFTNTLFNTSTPHSSSALGNGNKTGNQLGGPRSQVNLNVASMNSESSKQQNNEDDDITYLFTVESSSKEQMVLEIDLQSQAMNLVPNKSAVEIIDLVKDSKMCGVKAKQSTTIKKRQATSPSKSRKRKLSENDAVANKRSSHQPKCAVCAMNYDDVIGKDDNMYISSSCRHIFCRSCISKNGNSNVCPTCGIKFLAFRRLFR